MNRILKFIVLFSIVATVSHAALWVQTHEFGGDSESYFFAGNDLSPYTENWSFNKFDDHGGAWTLSSINIEFVLYAWDGFIGQDNDGTTEVVGPVGFNMAGNVSSPDVHWYNDFLVSLDADILQQATFNLAANDGDATADHYDVGGLDWDSFSGADESNPAQDSASTPIFPTSFSDFIGDGTFDMSLSATQAKYTIDEGAVALFATPQKADGFVRITYDFVPEPATMSLLGAGGLVALIANRFRRKDNAWA